MTDTELFKQWREYLGGDNDDSIDRNSISVMAQLICTFIWKWVVYEAHVSFQLHTNTSITNTLFMRGKQRQ